MRAHLRVLTGGRGGGHLPLGEPAHVVGRGSGADLRFDPERDLAVSAEHAEIVRSPEGWVVRDLESRNGTFVNGRRIRGPTRLESGDVLRFGRDGPEARFHLGGPDPGPAGPGSVTAEVRARTARALHKARRRTVAVLLLLAVAAGGVLHLTQRERSAWERERAELLAAVDSVLDTDARLARERSSEEMEERLRELNAALERSRAEVESIRAELVRLEEQDAADRSQVRALRAELEEAHQALARQQLAASLDFDAIEETNRHAVAQLWVETDDDEVVTGTAFAVSPEAALITARHLVEVGPDEPEVRRMGVQFSDSDQVFPVRLVAVSERADLALVQAENIAGAVPVVRRLNERADTLHAGAPVASMGFPLGGGPPSPDDAPVPARPLLSAGVIVDTDGEGLQVQGFGDAGSSGSPLFDAGGEVVGVVYGGVADRPGGILMAVPSSEAAALLDAVGAEAPEGDGEGGASAEDAGAGAPPGAEGSGALDLP